MSGAGRLRGDAGQVGGIEALPFGLLIFVAGSLLIANAWAVVDAKFATDAAARQAVRTFVESDDHDAGLAAVEATYEVPALSIPLIGGYGRAPFRVTSRHSELVDPFRAGLAGSAAACA